MNVISITTGADYRTFRTHAQLQEEIGRLVSLLERVPRYTAFGDDNHAAMLAQVEALEDRMTFDEAVDAFEHQGDHVFTSSMDSLEWLREDVEPPSASWEDLLAAIVETQAETQERYLN